MTVSADPLETARAALAPGEHLIWADRPDPQTLARARLPQFIRGVLGLAVIAGFFWLSFLPNWPGGLRGLVLAVFLGAAALYALWLLVAPLVARHAAGDIVYALTDRRLLILEDWPFRKHRSFAPVELDDPLVSPASSGAAGARSSVVFIHHKLPWWRRSAGGSYRIEAFYGIADAGAVAERINALRTPEPAADDDA